MSHQKTIEDFVIKNVPDGSRLIDVGCGAGEMALWLAKIKKRCLINGVDTNKEDIHLAKAAAGSKASIKFHMNSAEALTQKFGASQYDIAISNHSFHHYENTLQVLQEIYMILKPAGRLLLTELEPAYGKTQDDCIRFPTRKIISILKKANFRTESFATAPPGVFLIIATKHTKSLLMPYSRH